MTEPKRDLTDYDEAGICTAWPVKEIVQNLQVKLTGT